MSRAAKRYGNYEITHQLGAGGMGVVYAARHVLLDRECAVKVLLPAISRNPDAVQRLFNEARATAKIRHPCVIEVYDFGYAEDGSAYIAMERLFGRPLAALVAGGLMPIDIVIDLARQLASALQAAHACGVVHRDLKPDNVLVVADTELGRRVKVLDFGIARLDDVGPPSKTRTGMLIGTPTYMAPEQCRGVRVDHRADLYAFGCIVFEMITGRPPFEGEAAGDLLAAHMCTPAPRASSRVAGVPLLLDQLIARLLAKDPSARVQSAGDVIAELDLLVLPEPSHRTPISPSGPTTLSSAINASVVADRPPRRAHRIALVATTLVICGAGATMLVRRSAGVDSSPVVRVEAVPATIPASVPPDAETIPAPPDSLVTEPSVVAPPDAMREPPPKRRRRSRVTQPEPELALPNSAPSTTDILVEELTPP